MKEVNFEEAVTGVKKLLLPVADALQQGNEFNMIWHPEEWCWKKR